METSYFTKVENKYVFNLSLIFWHLFIALTTLTIIVCLVVLLWSLTPAAKKKIEKQPYPEKAEYPEPVKVSFNDLKLDDIRQIETPPVQEIIQIDSTPEIFKPIESYEGKEDYEISLNTLKTLIPPSKYSWEGSGYWTYPYGERYWTFYKQEKYRKWNISQAGIMEKLEKAYKNSNVKTFPEKKQLLDAVINIIKLLPENNRLNALQYLIEDVSDNMVQNINTYQSIAKVANKVPDGNLIWIYRLSSFGERYPVDGPRFIDYISTIIEKFDSSVRSTVIEGFINSYYGHFDQNLNKQKESTDLFIPLLTQIKPDLQSYALSQYFTLYVQKNYERDVEISKIENEYQQKVSEVELQYESDLLTSEMEYQNKKVKKAELRLKSLFGIGGGVMVIVLIATLLVFLSIQRSVRKIEEKISPNDLA